MTEVNKALHSVRNTYQALFMYFEDVKNGRDTVISSDKAMELMQKDVLLMTRAGKECKACKAKMGGE